MGFKQAGHAPSFFANMLLTEQVPPLFLLEFAHPRKQGISSHRLEQNINHPLHCWFGKSMSKSGPTNQANLLELRLLVPLVIINLPTIVNNNEYSPWSWRLNFNVDYWISIFYIENCTSIWIIELQCWILKRLPLETSIHYYYNSFISMDSDRIQKW